MAKLVKEHINFERGQDPLDAMGVGIVPGDFIDNLVRIMNDAYFQYEHGSPVITKNKRGIYKDVDWNSVSKKDLIEWFKEILTEEEVDLSKQQIKQLLIDINNKQLSRSGKYPGLDIPVIIS